MLKDVDKARLDKVLRLVENADIKFLNKYIIKLTGYSKSEVSRYMSGANPMPDNFYQAIIKHFGQPTPVPVQQDVTSFAGDIVTKMLVNDAKMDVLYQQVIQVMAQSTGRPAALISAELQQAIELLVLGKMEQSSKL